MMNKGYPLDSRLQHRAPGAAAMTADTTLGDFDQLGKTRTEFLTKLYVESIDTTTGDEKYVLRAELSNDDFVTVDAVGGIVEMGDATQLASATDTAVGDELEMRWTTEVAGVKYQYWRIRLDVSGTSPSMGAHVYSTVMT